jgi:uncharacterized protein YdaU (DUF1376 family)
MSVSQKRRAPAFQEYAADMLANAHYRMMALDEKGLFSVLRYECWVNDRIPAKHDELARYLGIELQKIKACLTPRVLTFFESDNGYLLCPELDAYRAKLIERSNKQSTGGSKGGKITQQRHKNNQANLGASLKPLSRNKTNKEEENLNNLRLLEEGNTEQLSDPWVDEYEASPEASSPYLLASRGI